MGINVQRHGAGTVPQQPHGHRHRAPAGREIRRETVTELVVRRPACNLQPRADLLDFTDGLLLVYFQPVSQAPEPLQFPPEPPVYGQHRELVPLAHNLETVPQNVGLPEPRRLVDTKPRVGHQRPQHPHLGGGRRLHDAFHLIDAPGVPFHLRHSPKIHEFERLGPLHPILPVNPAQKAPAHATLVPRRLPPERRIILPREPLVHRKQVMDPLALAPPRKMLQNTAVLLHAAHFQARTLQELPHSTLHGHPLQHLPGHGET